jgi:folate-binding protein YgfZ
MAAASSEHGGASSAPGYQALAYEVAAYEDSSRRVFEVTGDRATDALNGLVTADLEATGADAAFPTLILTPKGKVLADAVILRAGDRVLLDVPKAAWADLEDHFSRYLPPRFARLEPSSLRVVRVRGPLALERERTDPVLVALDGPTYTARDGSHWAVAAYRGGLAARPPEGFDLYLPPEVAHGLDLPEASAEAWELWRIESGIPLFGRDITQDNLPQETGLVPERVSFAKGCYTGQEVVARIHYRGHVNRNLCGIRIGGPSVGPPLHAGDELVAEDRVVGTVTSAVESPTHGWIGLGYVRRELEAGDEVVVRPTDGETDIPVFARIVNLPFGS